MKSTLINRIRLAGVSSALVAVGAVTLLVPSASASLLPGTCPPPVLGDDGQPVTVECDPISVDVLAPVVRINNPTTTTLKRNQPVLITALATDNVSVSTTELYVDNMLVDSAPGSTSGATWTPTQKGSHTITAKAYDPSGNVGMTVMEVTVK